MIKNKKKLISVRDSNKKAKIGSEISCPSCGSKFTKKAYNSTFCKTKKGTKCKDNFWNNVDEKKRKNTTRISPASASFMAKQQRERRTFNPDDYEHPFSPTALGQWDY